MDYLLHHNARNELYKSSVSIILEVGNPEVDLGI